MRLSRELRHNVFNEEETNHCNDVKDDAKHKTLVGKKKETRDLSYVVFFLFVLFACAAAPRAPCELRHENSCARAGA